MTGLPGYLARAGAVAGMALTAAGSVTAIYSAIINSDEFFVSGISLIVAGCFTYCVLLFAYHYKGLRDDARK